MLFTGSMSVAIGVLIAWNNRNHVTMTGTAPALSAPLGHGIALTPAGLVF
jgi:hypothetical protein